MKIQLAVLAFICVTTIVPCFGQQMHHVVLTVNQPPQLAANAGSDIDDASVLDVIIGGSPSATGGTGPYNYSWLPVTNLSDPAISNPELDLIAAANSYSVTVTDANGCTSVDEMDVNVSIVSIEESGSGIVVYPNPASRQLTIELNQQADGVFVYDNSGRLMITDQPRSLKHDVDLSSLSAGFYILKVKQGKKLQTVKLLIR